MDNKCFFEKNTVFMNAGSRDRQMEDENGNKIDYYVFHSV